jgi:predicted transcriptional regulator
MADNRCPNPRCTCVDCKCGPACRCGVMRLGSLERRVMDVVWGRPGEDRTARDVADRLPEYAYTTLATVLERLVGKELLTRRREGRVILYSASDTPAVHTALLMHEALAATRDPAAALACFVQSATPEDVAALRAAVEHLGAAAPVGR